MTVGPSHPIMSNTDRIESLEQEIEFVQHYLRWIPEAIADNKRQISRLQERVAALEEKLCLSELEAGAAN